MKSKRVARGVLFLAIAALAGFGGYQTHQWRSAQQPAAEAASAATVPADAGQTLMTLTLPDADGNGQALAQWRDKVLVVNFWATWCPPCLKEIPDFAAVSRRYQDQAVQFVGVSIDTADNVRRFSTEHNVPYPLLIGTSDTLRLAAQFGNAAQALPFTVILKPGGTIDYIKLGVLNEAELERKIQALLGS